MEEYCPITSFSRPLGGFSGDSFRLQAMTRGFAPFFAERKLKFPRRRKETARWLFCFAARRLAAAERWETV